DALVAAPDLRGAVGRSVVDQQDLVVGRRIVLRNEGVETRREIALRVVHWNDDRHEHADSSLGETASSLRKRRLSLSPGDKDQGGATSKSGLPPWEPANAHGAPGCPIAPRYQSRVTHGATLASSPVLSLRRQTAGFEQGSSKAAARLGAPSVTECDARIWPERWLVGFRRH